MQTDLELAGVADATGNMWSSDVVILLPEANGGK